MITKQVLMVEPTHFKVDYAINPYMRDETGALRQVNTHRAYVQWSKLVETFKKLGLKVQILKGEPHLPDMVFSANNSFYFTHPKTKKKTIVMGQMRSLLRQPEISFFENWYRKNGFIIEHLKQRNFAFEGCGDALLQPGTHRIWGGCGPRTDREVYGELRERFGFEVMELELIRPEFYHLDTCFSILNTRTVVVQREAFKQKDFQKIEKYFQTVIEIDLDENLKTFGANCFSPDGHNVVLQRGSHKLVSKLQRHGFSVHEVETGEFIKSGGSVFCLKMAL